MADDLNAIAISRMSTALVEHVAEIDCDVGHKIAALRSAAETLTNAVLVASLAASIANSMGPKR